MKTTRTCATISLLFLAVLFAAATACFPTFAADPGPEIAESIQPFVDRHVLAGAVMMVADKDRVLTTETVGYSDIAAAKLLAEDSVFWIASMSKPMTATAVMMMVDEGKVKLDDPVEKYLPEFKGQMVKVSKDSGETTLKAPVHPITVRNVLSHTSGLPFKSPVEEPTLDLLPLREAVASYAKLPLEFEPDSRYSYANAGINTAARILEVVSGMAYEEFMQERLFTPLGMTDTTFWPNEEQLSRLSKAYRPNAEKTDLEETTVTQLKYPLSDREQRFPMPAGGLFSTAADVTRFSQMVLNGGTIDGKRYVSEKAVREMTSKQTAEGIANGYGLGWAAGGDWFGHGGAYATNMTIDTKRGLVMVYMVHHAGFPGDGNKALGVFLGAAREKYGR